MPTTFKHERVRELSLESPLAAEYLNELRDVHCQKDRLRFRFNLRRLAWLAGFALAKDLETISVDVQTPLGVASSRRIKTPIVIGSVLRAGLPFHEGLLEVFDNAESCFIGAARVEGAVKSDAQNVPEVEVELGYLASPNLQGKTLILADPMIATGGSLILALTQLMKRGKPKQIHIVGAIASVPGIQKVLAWNAELTIWCAGIDSYLNSNAYIVPGLGDAGDLSYGQKGS